MPNNITSGLNFVVAIQTASWGTIGFNSGNVLEVYGTDTSGNPVSWKPGRSINTMPGTGIIQGQGYQINSISAMDKSAYFTPPYVETPVITLT